MSGDCELCADGKDESFRGDGANDGIWRARGGGEGLSCARMMRLASTDEGSERDRDIAFRSYQHRNNLHCLPSCGNRTLSGVPDRD